MGVPSVSAIVLAYGTEPWLVDVVKSVLASTNVAVDVVVVDNGCVTDAVDSVAALDGVRIVRPSANLGFAGGVNLGAAAATGEFLALVNSDALVDPDALGRLVAVAAEETVGLAMASVRLGGNPDLINSAGNPLHVAGLSWAGGNGSPATGYALRRQVPVASGCCLVLRRALWVELGGFADEYFAYHEDTELSVRAWQRGLTVEYVPDAVVIHHYEFARTQAKFYLLERNRLLLVLSVYQRRTLLLLAPVLAVTEAAMVVTAVAGGWLGAKLRGWGWLWTNRRRVMARRRQLQRERRVPDGALAHLMTAHFDPSNVEAPPGIRVYNAVIGTYWRLVRPLLPSR